MKRPQLLVFLLLTLILAQLACNAPVAIPMTGAAQTITPITPSGSTQAGGACTEKVTFVSDVTVPDNTEIPAGQTFTKTWRVKNDGTCTWGPNGYPLSALIYTGGDKLGGPDQMPLPQVVKPGETADISIQLTAPANPGTYISQWMFRVDNGAAGSQNLGVGSNGKGPLYVQIVVK